MFLILGDETVHRVSFQRFERLYQGCEAAPEFSTQKIRYILAAVETVDREPVEILYMDFGVLPFNDSGRIDPDAVADQMRLAGDMIGGGWPRSETGNVVDARHRFARREFANKYRWEPSERILHEVRDLILGAP